MKKLAGNDRGAIIEEYRKAIDFYIASKSQESLLKDSQLENYINQRISRAENHLSSMMARTGMDVSMVFMGMIMLVERLSNGKYTKQELFELLRTEGARYFKTVVQKDKEEKRNNK